MPRWLTLVIQLTAVGAQVAAPYIVSPSSVNTFHTALGALQLFGAVAAHSYNPDGTPASVPYFPAK